MSGSVCPLLSRHGDKLPRHGATNLCQQLACHNEEEVDRPAKLLLLHLSSEAHELRCGVLNLELFDDQGAIGCDDALVQGGYNQL